MTAILLADNGSVRVNATLQLRVLAGKLSALCGQPVYPVSLQHANRIAPQRLGGEPAQIFVDFISQQLQQGVRDFLMLPLFFGKSRALTSFVPEQLEKLREHHGDFGFRMAEVIYPLTEGEPLLADIIHDHLLQTARQHGLEPDNAVLVDHGSPAPGITEVRKRVAEAVQQRLPSGAQLQQAVMERREGREYDFNGDLLEHWLRQNAQRGAKSAIVLLLFFLPGRHAGEGGDIADICQRVSDDYPAFRIAISPLIAQHPAFLSILQARLEQALSNRPPVD